MSETKFPSLTLGETPSGADDKPDELVNIILPVGSSGDREINLGENTIPGISPSPKENLQTTEINTALQSGSSPKEQITVQQSIPPSVLEVKPDENAVTEQVQSSGGVEIPIIVQQETQSIRYSEQEVKNFLAQGITMEQIRQAEASFNAQRTPQNLPIYSQEQINSFLQAGYSMEQIMATQQASQQEYLKSQQTGYISTSTQPKYSEIIVTHVSDKNYPEADKIYTGRQFRTFPASIYGNPYTIKDPRTPDIPSCIRAYYQYVMSERGAKIRESLPSLKDKVLTCFCKKKPNDPNTACHADVLKFLAEGKMPPALQNILPQELVNTISNPEIKTQTNRLSIDRILGSILCLFTGDALGLPFEFKQSNIPYTGKIDHPAFYKNPRSKDQGRTTALGQFSDDGEMSKVLMDSLITNKKYNPDDVIRSYLEWGASKTPFMGSNTKALFKGEKGTPIQMKTYIARYTKKNSGLSPFTPFYAGRVTYGEPDLNQGNGSLMRVMGLACIGNNSENIMESIALKAIEQDCWWTNCSNVNLDCSIVQVAAIRMALFGQPPSVIYNTVRTLPVTPEVKQVFTNIENNIEVPFEKDANGKRVKGWVTLGLYCSMRCLAALASNPNMLASDLFNWVIRNGGDTDSQACIAGALIGAIIGYEKIMKDDPTTAGNFNVVVNSYRLPTDVPRPPKYQITPESVMKLAQDLHGLGEIVL